TPQRRHRFLPAGVVRCSPVDAHEIAAVARVLLTATGHAGHAFDVTGPKSLTVGQMVGILGRALNREIQYVDVAEAAAGQWMIQKLGFSQSLAAALVETLGALRNSQFADVAATVPRLTGGDPTTYQAWCRKN